MEEEIDRQGKAQTRVAKREGVVKRKWWRFSSAHSIISSATQKSKHRKKTLVMSKKKSE
jgi:hypothetical protein